ncbi:hypothetical protein [Bradyrhizobium sp. JYMT SZCCT0428]|uniref:hypothetical protein n=1 Tax=Bradyrhizobium sp. JYMT SZCCT0428 TaxID=2807673 RepID=UPI001BA666ED|nr:hypothetical protein [Bradyrhizobium sp. JYMT SZCCT0428]MBR1150873.1 hypothetical protein [Bradyrhizobium sp. JYMT SZCCT0428]
MAKDMHLICHSVKAKYFLFWGLTPFPDFGSDLPVGLEVAAAAVAQLAPRPPRRSDPQDI